jgi:hypothetical protein
MDLPWNPAVLEQRIGRVHRMGQTRGVQVVNFVAQGTIEEGMLSVLAFKQSLFAGMLDGGQSEVVLHGTRLSKFMETVEQVAGAVDNAAPVDEPSHDTLPLDATEAAGAESEADGEAEYRPPLPAGESEPTGKIQTTGETEPAALTEPPGAEAPATGATPPSPVSTAPVAASASDRRRPLGTAARRRRTTPRRTQRRVKRRTGVTLGTDRYRHRPTLPQAARPRPRDRPAPRRRPAQPARRTKISAARAIRSPNATTVRSPMHRAISLLAFSQRAPGTGGHQLV